MQVKNLFAKAGLAAILMTLAACASTAPEGASDPIETTKMEEPAGPTPGSQADLEENVGHRVYFALDQYTLTPESQATLARQAAWLKEYPEARIRVEGNCDERGTREYNLALGARRANAAKAFLASQGIDPARITTVSYGKERPIDPSSNEAAWSKNRNSTSMVVAAGYGS